jgi:hypothetical protein
MPVYDTHQISEPIRYLILQQDVKQQARETAKRIVHRVRSVLRKNRKTMLRPMANEQEKMMGYS